MKALWIVTLALWAAAGSAPAQEGAAGAALVTPAQPVGRKSERGIVVSSQPDGFEIELAGQQLEPLAADRLLWNIDGQRIELLLLRRSADPAWSATRAIRDIEASTGAKDVEFVGAVTGPTPPHRVWATASETVAAAAIAKGVLIIKLSGPGPAGAEPARDYLRRTLLSLREAGASARQEAVAGGSDTGVSLQQQLRMNMALTGEAHFAVLNNKLATAADSTVPGTLALDPASLTDFARWLLGLGESTLTVSVFDGRVAHAIVLDSYDFASETFVYWDPWGQGSFLQKANNGANVDARPHPTRPRYWLISFAELESVLYSLVGRQGVLYDAIRLCTLAAAPQQQVFDIYAELARDDDPKHRLFTPERLEGRARYLYRIDRPDLATALLALRSTLPGKAPADDLLALARSGGVPDLAAHTRGLQQAAGTAPARQAPTPLIRDAAEATEFFKFFGLQQVQADARSARYRPRSPQFARRVELILQFDAAGAVATRELAIRHDFITDPAASMFAADFTKSFLLFAVDAADRAAVQPLASEIFGGRARRPTIPGAYRGTTALPAMPSAGLLTFRGARQAFGLVLPATTLDMRHQGSGEQVELRLTVAPR